MNPFTLRLLFTGAADAAKYFREQGDKRKRETYDALLAALEDRNITDADELEQLYDAARTQAGELTRAAHARLDKRRAAFNAALPGREAQRTAWRAEAKAHKKKARGKGRTVAAGLLGAGALAGAGWALWEFWLKDKLEDAEPEIDLTDVARSGEAKLVYSTSTENEGVFAPDADTYGEHAAVPPTEPAEGADSAQATGLTADAADAAVPDGETLSTLDTLDDSQRKGTKDAD
ncbi:MULTISPECIES: hypothetical protein [Corynebacterium]|uniref:Uncharacterized protein n=1 Tax=Corynebacterium imitans TaxID=156978 RepID=A0A076NDR3_9CORY|nr:MULTISPECIES: hypothetical protein [Corynebacterium]AIJ32544.1 hypothetical protein CIMIT_00125 [Corynebacterium imitans]MDK8305372.1 hypothetical protein [Corynebacterium imitans]MDK8636327.1 hypothetical protein [Corynebacterium imitans]MDK8771525.1 hypothetical protein [Corynebacterium imitans]OFP37045.1 hypothetical protein HMPREF2990_04380 [Corynebacterium sp. HMSC071B10]